MRPAMDVSSRGRRSSLPVLARNGLRQVRELAIDFAALAVTDARSAAVRLAWLLSAGLVVALLVVSAWIAVVAGGLVWLLGAGITWPKALGVAALVNIVGAICLAFWVRGLVTEPPFAATLRQLRGEGVPQEGEHDEAR